jgi:transglutaminase-like putative cysteine protease
MNHRLTLTTAAAVLLASIALYPLFQGIGWFWAGAGAIVVIAAAGTATRLPALPAGVIATVLALGATAPLLTNPAWYWELLGLVVVSCAAASVTRLRLLPAVASLITYLAGLLLYLNLLFAGPEAAGWIVPTKNSLHHLWHLASLGAYEQRFRAPVPGHHGVELLAAAGIGLMAVAADLLAVRLRSPAIAGLPLLALFSVPITVSARQGAIGATVAFCLGMTGYLALLAADGRERLRIWGRLVTLWQSGSDDDEPVRGPDTRALAASGRRIGLAAVSLAIFIPLLLPGLRVHKFFSGHGDAGQGSGSARIVLTDPIVQMAGMLTHGSNATVLTYHSDNPNAKYQYLQDQVLNYAPNGSTWLPVLPSEGNQLSPGGSLPPIPYLSYAAIPAQSFHTRITVNSGVTGYSSPLTFLPVPYAPQDVQIPDGWQVDPSTLMVFLPHGQLSGLNYRVTSDDIEPTVPQLEQAKAPPAPIARQYLPFPSPARKQLLALAQQITAGDKTAIQKALALQAWFLGAGHFTYSLNVHLRNDTQGLVDFLTKTRSGYCQQFAFAMAALARVLGIPARVAVGYTAGTPVGPASRDNWKVTEADAHAWPELFFQGAGWLRFEPTPGGAGGQGTATVPVYAQTNTTTGPSTSGPGVKPVGTSGSGKVGTGKDTSLGRRVLPGQGDSGTKSSTHGSSVPVAAIAIAVLALIAVTPRTTRTVVRRRRWQAASGDNGRAHAAWRELHDDLADYGIGWRVSESPRAVSRRLATTLGLDAAGQLALDRVARAEERARYAKVAQAPESLRADVDTIRRAVAATSSPATRWRARLLPPSALVPMRAGLQHALDIFGWLDAAGLRVRGRVRQLGPEGMTD